MDEIREFVRNEIEKDDELTCSIYYMLTRKKY